MADVKHYRHKIKTGNAFFTYLHQVFLAQKLNNWLGYFLIAAIAIAFGILTAKEFVLGLGLLGVVLGVFTLLACLLNTELGLYINMVYIFFAYHISRLFFNDQVPIGVISDILIATTFLGLFIKNPELGKKAGHFVRSRPVLFLLIVFIYLCLELLNPMAHSVEGWFSTIRKVLGSVLVTFIAYNVFKDYKKIWRFIKVLFVCAVLTGLYGCIQQWHGLFSFEELWVKSNKIRYSLIYVDWNYRKFSILSDPTAFGLIMAGCALFFLIIGISERRVLSKCLLFVGCIFMLLGMAYSGTRTAIAMLVAGAGVFVLLTIHKKASRFFAIFAILTLLFLMYVPIYDNPTLIRFRTSFSASEDESYKVRERNRAAIQPFIYSHPFGGGLGTTGGNGLKYDPGHQLAGFPPDSGYLNKALETGWIGLALNCLLYFITMQYAVRGYFNAKSNRIKMLFAASAAFLFSFYLAEMVQEAVGLVTNIIVYNAVVALVIRLREISTKEKKDVEGELSYHL
jgi:putative inorganic carbon (hco3(-)) transporter